MLFEGIKTLNFSEQESSEVRQTFSEYFYVKFRQNGSLHSPSQTAAAAQSESQIRHAEHGGAGPQARPEEGQTGEAAQIHR